MIMAHHDHSFLLESGKREEEGGSGNLGNRSAECQQRDSLERSFGNGT